MSTPKFWGGVKKNTTGVHGLNVHGPRESGKTAFDRASGKVLRRQQNADSAREWNMSGGTRGYRTRA